MTVFKAPAPEYVGPGHDSGDGNKPIHRIVLHGTVSPTEEGGARRIAAFFCDPSSGGSAHYVVDPGDVVQVVFDSRIAWHAPPNGNSIGVELCDWVGGGPDRSTPLPLKRWTEEAHAAMLRRAARLVAELCLAYDVPPYMRTARQLRSGKHGLCEHDDVSRAWGQSTHWDLGWFPRGRFARMVRAEIADIRGDHANARAQRARAHSRGVRARDALSASVRRAVGRGRHQPMQHSLSDAPRR